MVRKRRNDHFHVLSTVDSSLSEDIQRIICRSWKNPFHSMRCFFLRHIKSIVHHPKPNAIICTHSSPLLLSKPVKNEQNITVPVVNVYTDYFIHHLLRTEAIDYHFIGYPYIKTQLQEKGLQPNEFLSPASRFIRPLPKVLPKTVRITSLPWINCQQQPWNRHISAHNKKISSDAPIDYYMLCGKNRRSYEQLKVLHHPRIIPIFYISSWEEMNQLYNEVDFTNCVPIREGLFKRLPIFIYHTHLGQEDETCLCLINCKSFLIP